MSLTPTQREKIILDEVQRAGSVSLKALAERLSVSSMTVHRDVNKLAAEGLVVKSHGEVLFPVKSKGEDEVCAMCHKPISERTAFLLMLTTGEQKRACCAHCGLMLYAHVENIWQAMTTDFLHGHMLSANQAFFVMESELTVCCLPSILSFGTEVEAQKFALGFGGRVVLMGEVLQYFQAAAKLMVTEQT